jgi:hypothetical protein
MKSTKRQSRLKPKKCNRRPKKRNPVKWSIVNFGKYTGLSLPQIILRDADYFYWGLNNGTFSYGKLAREARDIEAKAKAIKIPKRHPGRWLIEYSYEDNGAFGGFRFVKARETFYSGRRRMDRSPHLDLSWVRRGRTYDKWGSKTVLRDFRRCYFDGKYFSKRRVEKFFNTKANFAGLSACDEGNAGSDFDI